MKLKTITLSFILFYCLSSIVSAQTGEGLLTAAKEGNAAAIRLQLRNDSNKANINITDKFGNTPLLLALSNGQEEAAEILIKEGADINFQNKSENATQDTPLILSALHGLSKITALLIDKGADIQTTNSRRRNALHAATYKGHLECVDILLKTSINIDAEDEYKNTALHYAFLNISKSEEDQSEEHFKIVRSLLLQGANPSAVNSQRKRAMPRNPKSTKPVIESVVPIYNNIQPTKALVLNTEEFEPTIPIVKLQIKVTDEDYILDVYAGDKEAVAIGNNLYEVTLKNIRLNTEVEIKATNIWMKTKKQKQRIESSLDRKLALVIGNADYQAERPLNNTVNDADDMEKALTKLGFKVIKVTNGSELDMINAIENFKSQLTGYGVGLFYYSGHGVQVKGNNYLIPTDADLKNETQVTSDCINANDILVGMEVARSHVNIVILDACRDNPFALKSSSKGLGQMSTPKGTIMVYATTAGDTASDESPNNRNGVFTAALLKEIKNTDLDILEIMSNTSREVVKQTNSEQVPWISTSLFDKFYMKKGKN